MKKYILLSCAFILAGGLNVHAADIDAEVVTRRVSVSVSDTLGVEIPTIQMLNEDKTRVIYTSEGYFNGEKYVFDDFSFPTDEKTGNYIIRVGENGKITETKVYYVSYDETVEILKELSSDTSSMSAIIEKRPEVFGVSLSDFAGLSTNWKTRAEQEIRAADIKYETEEDVLNSCQTLSAVMKRIISYAQLISSGSTEKTNAAIANIPGLDLTYWAKLDDLNKNLSDYFKSQQLDEMTIDEQGISKAFDGAVLTAVINSCDWGLGKEALGYYCRKGLLSIASEYLNSGSEVYKALRNLNIRNYNDIPEQLKVLCNQPSNPPGIIGGPSGVGSPGGGANSKPTAPFGAYGETSSEKTKISFSDLDGAAWARAAIEALAEKGVIAGRGEGKFEPQSKITRGEFVKIIVDAFSLVDNNASVSFEDVPEDLWSYKYIASAYKAGIIHGKSDTYFGAGEYISRQDMAVILAKVAEIFGIDTNGEPKEFYDYEMISDYAKESVKRLTAAGIISGMEDGNFLPAADVTRAQAAQVVYEMMNKGA